jgi:hypothetical protein
MDCFYSIKLKFIKDFKIFACFNLIIYWVFKRVQCLNILRRYFFHKIHHIDTLNGYLLMIFSNLRILVINMNNIILLWSLFG